MPYTLADIRALAPRHVGSTALSRRPDIQKAYEQHISEQKGLYGSTKDYILHRIFELPLHTENGKKCVAPYPEPMWRVVLNQFPYDLASGLEHWNVWYSEPYRDYVQAAAIAERVFKGREYVWFANIEKHMSLPACFHIHVIVRGVSETSLHGGLQPR